MPFSAGAFSAGRVSRELFEEFALFAGEFAGSFDLHVNDDIASRMAVHLGDALLLQAELRACLRAFRNFEHCGLAERRNGNFGTEGGLREIDGDGAVQVIFVALEERRALLL